MIQMNIVAVSALQATVDKVVCHANRVREWELLERRLREVERSFKQFWEVLQGVETADDLTKQVLILTEFWTQCQDPDIPDLNSFVEHLEHIHQPFPPGESNYPDIQGNIASLIEKGAGIQGALADACLKELKEQAAAFNTILHSANYRSMKQNEIDRLCEVTYRLSMQLGQDFEEVKEFLTHQMQSIQQLMQNLQTISCQLQQLRTQLGEIKIRVPRQWELSLTHINTSIDQTLIDLSTSVTQIEDATVSSLQETIDAVTRYSNRVREWNRLEQYLRGVERSFKPFWLRLQPIETSTNLVEQARTLKESWNSCQDIDVVELNSFAQSCQHILDPFGPGSPARYPQLHEGMTTLMEVGKSIHEDLNNNQVAAVQEHSHKFQVVLTGQLTTCHTMMEHEVEQLCQIAHELHEKIKE